MYRSQFFALFVCAASVFAAPAPDATGSFAKAQIGRLPLRFEENLGQAGPEARYLARAGSYSLEMTAAGPVMAVGGRRVELLLRGANPAPEIRAEERLAATTNYMIGRREAWHSGIANFARVRYRRVYAGIDVVYYGNQSQLEYDFVVAPGADPDAIRLRFAGADKVAVTADGDLSVEAAGERILQKKPLVYQDNHPVAGRYRLTASNEVAVVLGAYDRGKQLVIDPVLVYSQYIGTRGYEQITAMKLGLKGLLYLAGTTNTGDIQGADGVYKTTSSGLTDIFLAVVDTNADANFALKYFTYFGGGNLDVALDMAVDSNGVVYLTGTTTSTDFPLAGNAVQSSGAATAVAAFVSKIDTSLGGTDALLYSTFLGGTDGNTSGNAIALDKNNQICVVGTTKAGDFPVTSSAYAAVRYGAQDAFIAKINPDSDTPLVYSTYMGGELNDDGRGVAVGANGLIYFAGSTVSTQFPMEGPGYRQQLQGAVNIVIGVIDPTKSGTASMPYSTYFGGSSVDEVRRIALDVNGNLVLTGYTLSGDFPTTPDALTQVPLGNSDVFISIVNPNAPSRFLVYSTYFGGSQGEVAYGLAPDSAGNIYVTGYTLSPDLFTVGAPQTGWGGGIDLFVAKIKPGTPGRAGVLFSTYLGGRGQYVGNSLAVGPDGSVYVAGYGSEGLPTTGPGYAGGLADGYFVVLK